MRRALALFGSVLIVLAVLLLTWVAVVFFWQDPFTAWYTHREQSRLAATYDRRAEAFVARSGSPAGARSAPAVYPSGQVARLARAYGRTVHTGDPVGRLQIKRIGLNMVVVQGTDEETLKKGPGHYLTTGMPGGGQLIYVAGHRTTYLAPFSHIDSIRNGDFIVLTVPYGTFTYRAFRHYIVPSTQLAVLVSHGREILRLQACHPRFFATHRYLVDARLVAFRPVSGTRTIQVKQVVAAR
jgi:sortase A